MLGNVLFLCLSLVLSVFCFCFLFLFLVPLNATRKTKTVRGTQHSVPYIFCPKTCFSKCPKMCSFSFSLLFFILFLFSLPFSSSFLLACLPWGLARCFRVLLYQPESWGHRRIFDINKHLAEKKSFCQTAQSAPRAECVARFLSYKCGMWVCLCGCAFVGVRGRPCAMLGNVFFGPFFSARRPRRLR